MRLRKRCPLTTVLGSLLGFAAAWLLSNSGDALGAAAQKKVLLFYNGRSDMLGNIVVDRAIRTILGEEFGIDVDIRSEYFEMLPVINEDYPVLLSWLRRKYSGTIFDVVVPVGANALMFVRQYHHDLFNGAQIVYWGPRASIDNGGSGPAITGVVTPETNRRLERAFAFISNLQPDLQRLVVVSGASSVDRNWEDAARRELHQFENRVAITYLSGLSLENVQKGLMNLPGKTAILFLTMNQDGDGKYLLKSDALNKVVEKATAPVYSTSAIHLDTGIIGGALIDQESMAVDAAGLIVRLLRGESIKEMPIQESSLVPMVNWKGLNRWGIDEGRLPQGTVIMYKEESILRRYRWQIFGIISLCTIEAVLIVALLIQRAHRRQAEKALQESKRLLQSSIDALDARIALLDEKGTIIAINRRWQSFAKINGHGDGGNGVGRNYLDVSGSIPKCEERVADGIRGLISGEPEDFCCIYSSAHADRRSWFQVRVNRFYTDGVLRLVVSHEDVTEIKEAHDAQRQLTTLLLRAQDEERRRIARDLHDVTVQNVVAMKGDLSSIQRGSEGLDPGAMEMLQESSSICDEVIKELRTLSYLLHPPFLDEAGLVTAVKWFVRGFIQRSGIQVELLVMEDIGRLPADVETALFRVVQESLTNIHRHSGSTIATIRLAKEQDTIFVRISDKGHGFSLPLTLDTSRTTRSAGVGLLGMNHRLKQLGGELEIESSPLGTTVIARLSISEGRYATYSGSR